MYYNIAHSVLILKYYLKYSIKKKKKNGNKMGWDKPPHHEFLNGYIMKKGRKKF